MNNPELYIKCPECKGHQQINRCRTCDNEWFIEYTAEIKLPEPGTGSKIVQEVFESITPYVNEWIDGGLEDLQIEIEELKIKYDHKLKQTT